MQYLYKSTSLSTFPPTGSYLLSVLFFWLGFASGWFYLAAEVHEGSTFPAFRARTSHTSPLSWGKLGSGMKELVVGAMGTFWRSCGCHGRLLEEEDPTLGRQGLPPCLSLGPMDALRSPFGPGDISGGSSLSRRSAVQLWWSFLNLLCVTELGGLHPSGPEIMMCGVFNFKYNFIGLFPQ